MAKGKNIAGENWGVCGKTNTGKTHTTLELAAMLQERSGKPIVVFDHTNNSSYSEIENEISIEEYAEADALLEEFEIYKITGCTDYDEFCQITTQQVHNCILILDDCGNYFSGNTSDIQMAFLTSPKNNGNDHFFQFHNFNDISPKLCRNLHMVVLKEQATEEVPNKVPNYELLTQLHREVMGENDKRDPDELWAYRIYDLYRDIVFYEDHEGIIKSEPGRTYFRNKRKR